MHDMLLLPRTPADFLISTGAAPHKCQYPGCEQTFGDPARRHRHMKAMHNHVPSKRRTQSDGGSLLLEVDMSEAEEEDST